MRFRCKSLFFCLVVFSLLLVGLSGPMASRVAADENGPSIMPDKDWWVMTGPKEAKDKSALQNDLARINAQFPNLQPELTSTSNFFWLPKDKWALLIGPTSNKKEAKAILAKIQRIVKDTKLVQTARRSPRPMPWFTGKWLLSWPNGNLNSMKLSVNRDSYMITGTVINDQDNSCGVSGKCSTVNKAMLSVSCPTSGLAFDMSLTLEDMNSGSGEFYLKGQKGPLSIVRN